MQAFAYHSDRDYPNSAARHRSGLLTFTRMMMMRPMRQYLLALSYYDQIDEIGRDQG